MKPCDPGERDQSAGPSHRCPHRAAVTSLMRIGGRRGSAIVTTSPTPRQQSSQRWSIRSSGWVGGTRQKPTAARSVARRWSPLSLLLRRRPIGVDAREYTVENRSQEAVVAVFIDDNRGLANLDVVLRGPWCNWPTAQCADRSGAGAHSWRHVAMRRYRADEQPPMISVGRVRPATSNQRQSTKAVTQHGLA